MIEPVLPLLLGIAVLLCGLAAPPAGALYRRLMPSSAPLLRPAIALACADWSTGALLGALVLAVYPDNGPWTASGLAAVAAAAIFTAIPAIAIARTWLGRRYLPAALHGGFTTSLLQTGIPVVLFAIPAGLVVVLSPVLHTATTPIAISLLVTDGSIYILAHVGFTLHGAARRGKRREPAATMASPKGNPRP